MLGTLGRVPDIYTKYTTNIWIIWWLYRAMNMFNTSKTVLTFQQNIHRKLKKMEG